MDLISFRGGRSSSSLVAEEQSRGECGAARGEPGGGEQGGGDAGAGGGAHAVRAGAAGGDAHPGGGDLLREQPGRGDRGDAGARAPVEGARREPAGELLVSVPFVVASLVPPAPRSSGPGTPGSPSASPSPIAWRGLGERAGGRRRARRPAHGLGAGGPPPPRDEARRGRRARLPGPRRHPPAPRGSRRPRLPRPPRAERQAAPLARAPLGRPRGEGRPSPLDHAPSLVDALLAGLGVAQVLDFMVDELVRVGRLVQVLPEEVAEGPAIHAVCAPGRRATPRVRAAFEAFAGAFGE